MSGIAFVIGMVLLGTILDNGLTNVAVGLTNLAKALLGRRDLEE